MLPEATKRFGPWLQDFSYWNLRPYDARSQINAVGDVGVTGWMLGGYPFNVIVEAPGPGTRDD